MLFRSGCKPHRREHSKIYFAFLRSLSADHYRILADRYDYLYKEVYDGIIPVLLKTLDLKPGHVVADIGSGTGFIAKELFEL